MNEKHIVVCDDDEVVYLSVRSIMEKMGYQVHEAHDGMTALRLAAQHSPAIMFQDIQMPGIDGYEVCRRLKSDSSLRRIPLAFVSAMDFEKALDQCLSVGADYFIAKPFAPNDLAADLYFLAAADFHPEYGTLTKLRITRSLAVEKQRKRSKGISVGVGEGIVEPPAPEAAPGRAPTGAAQLSRQVAGLIKRIHLLETLLHEKRILSDHDAERLRATLASQESPAAEEQKKDDVSWEG
ncbi:response regulator [bacterium]|nr:response regulator [bacterium]